MSTSEIRTLLIVDDEEDIRDILSSYVSALGVDILTAKNGLEALEIVKKCTVHAVLSDISMPEMTGLEFMTALRIERPEVPVVFITALSDKAVVKEALRLGAFDFIDKPFDEKDVLSVTTRALEIGVRMKNVTSLSEGNTLPKGGEAERIVALKKEKKMVGLLTVKNNQEKKKVG